MRYVNDLYNIYENNMDNKLYIDSDEFNLLIMGLTFQLVPLLFEMLYWKYIFLALPGKEKNYIAP